MLLIHCTRIVITAGLFCVMTVADNKAAADNKNTFISNNRLPGGETTVFLDNHQAFSQPSRNMPLEQRLDFSVGNSFFRNPWVMAPSSTDARDGLGPLFNTNGCQNCHIKDGRGHPPESMDDNAVSLLVRLSVPAKTLQHEQALVKYGLIPEPTYGGQLQDFSIPELSPEGRIQITYTDEAVVFKDGTEVVLRKPRLVIDQLAYGPMAEDVLMSARIAPPMIGLGLLEAIAEEHILSHADPQDKNADGISGKANRVWDVEEQGTVLGRFGWKAGQPNLRQQNAAAFNGDLGITSTLFVDENCTDRQKDCLQGISGGDPEVADHLLNQVTFYTHNLAVPVRRNTQSEQVTHGEQLFRQANCQGCHVDHYVTSTSEFPWLNEQIITPYSDLLLHDMGEGLADNRPEFLANGREWRTAPLWGIGLTEVVGGKAYYLHDGRARSLMEAVLWHGGEAEDSKQTVLSFNAEERAALIAFLESL